MASARARRPNQSRRRTLAPAELERLLSHPEALIETGWTEALITRERKQLCRLHRRLYGRAAIVASYDQPAIDPDGDQYRKPPPPGGFAGGECCSHAWADEIWLGQVAGLPPGQRRCRACGAMTPPNHLGSGGVCYDCFLNGLHPVRANALSGLSASVLDVHHLRGRR